MRSALGRTERRSWKMKQVLLRGPRGENWTQRSVRVTEMRLSALCREDRGRAAAVLRGEPSLVLVSPENRCDTGWAAESLQGLSDASPSGRGLTTAEICVLDMRSKAVFGFSSKSGASALGTPSYSSYQRERIKVFDTRP